MDWGIKFHDNSVMHPWNGRTQEMRARETLKELQGQLRNPDNPLNRMVLVVRESKDAEWKEIE